MRVKYCHEWLRLGHGSNNALESQIYILELFAGYAAVLHDQEFKYCHGQEIRKTCSRPGLEQGPCLPRSPVTDSLNREGYQPLKALCQERGWTT
jgi:hypothetical protein